MMLMRTFVISGSRFVILARVLLKLGSCKITLMQGESLVISGTNSVILGEDVGDFGEDVYELWKLLVMSVGR